MLTHKTIWYAIDELAKDNNLSPSGLARLAGLDPTTFNKSKRVALSGKLRWPSTESIAKILAVTNTSLNSFIQPIDKNKQKSFNHYPHFIQNDTGLNFNEIDTLETLPLIEHDDNIHLAFEVSQDYKDHNIKAGTIALLDMGSGLRRNDLVIIQSNDTEQKSYNIGHLAIETAHDYQIITNDAKQTILKKHCDWAARILWLSA